METREQGILFVEDVEEELKMDVRKNISAAGFTGIEFLT
jgi:hypothetical protein